MGVQRGFDCGNTSPAACRKRSAISFLSDCTDTASVDAVNSTKGSLPRVWNFYCAHGTSPSFITHHRRSGRDAGTIRASDNSRLRSDLQYRQNGSSYFLARCSRRFSSPERMLRAPDTPEHGDATARGSSDTGLRDARTTSAAASSSTANMVRLLRDQQAHAEGDPRASRNRAHDWASFAQPAGTGLRQPREGRQAA